MDEVDKQRQLYTAFVTFGSSLIGTTIGGSSFEHDNSLTLVAVARRGERLCQVPRQVVLEAGDTLLLECSPHVNLNTDRLKSQPHFFDNDQVATIGPKTLISALIMIGMIALSSLGVMTLLQAAFIAALAMVICRC